MTEIQKNTHYSTNNLFEHFNINFVCNYLGAKCHAPDFCGGKVINEVTEVQLLCKLVLYGKQAH